MPPGLFNSIKRHFAEQILLCIMASLAHLNSYVTPIPIPPVPPNFVFCNGDYGTGLRRADAIQAGGLLPVGSLPVTYSVGVPEMDGLAANISTLASEYRLPFLEVHGGISLSVDVSGPINIDRINVVPNDIRGMAAYVANQCLGRNGEGGFITKRIQGLVDFVTDPTSNIDAPVYPDSTALLTLTVSSRETSHTFPGDYDPQMAKFLWRAELDALSRVEPDARLVIANRVAKFAQMESHMRRMGTDVPWWGDWMAQGNRTAVTNVQLANMTTEGVTTARRRKRIAGLLR